MDHWAVTEIPERPEGPPIGGDGRPTPAYFAWLVAAAAAGDVEAGADLGLALYQRGDKVEGIRKLERALEAGNAVAGFNLGTCCWKESGQIESAEAPWKRAADLGDVDAMLGLVRIALRRGVSAAAAARPLVASLIATDEPFILVALALDIHGAGDKTTAIRLLERAVELDYAPASSHLARLRS
jgi:TPR repeat protein